MSYVIEDHGQRPMTVNSLVNMHRFAWAARTAEIRQRWALLAYHAQIPRLQAAVIEVTPLHKNDRSPQDVAACVPEAKAALDGIIDAGVLPDDSPKYVKAHIYLAPEVCGRDGMRIEIHPAKEGE